MSAIQKAQSLSKGPKRFHWTDEETLAIARRFFAIKKLKPDMRHAEAANLAQEAILFHRRKIYTPMNFHSLYSRMDRWKSIWEIWHLANRTQAKKDVVDMSRLLAEHVESQVLDPSHIDQGMAAEERHQKIVNEAWQNFATPAPTIRPVLQPQVILGPIELALQAMVKTAVKESIGELLSQQRTSQDDHFERMQGLLNSVHDSLMSYWDPEFKRLREIMPEFVGDTITPQLEAVRIKRKKILIVAQNNQRTLQDAVERKFNSIDFTFVDGQNQRSLGAGGIYDLVLCNGTNRPEVRRKLTELHGVKVVYHDGGANTMIDIIRKRLSI